ncbi:hypothetical protein LOC54_06015 [Acetobacter sp. AN02]|uniref:hypothetical protein n=1 Tax=Acetobacter sp. AN02 TaxID=2894186 RepID=UPI00243431BA|nr:hypothetical protein [Acetobacter sp. AN02]MDG6094666.1 hypothetical protein [Acetobacter sp. AN02]
MMRLTKLLLAVLCLTTLSACDDSTAPDQDDAHYGLKVKHHGGSKPPKWYKAPTQF